MLAYASLDDERHLERLVGDDAKAVVEHGRQRLEDNPMDADDGVLAYDGRIPHGKNKLDAIILELRSYAFPDAQATIAVPYTPKSSGRFRVHKPQLLQWDECDDFDQMAALNAFFEGVSAHEKGGKVWKKALDASK
jgi:hypothetical protein